jgi:hypothetical protein
MPRALLCKLIAIFDNKKLFFLPWWPPTRLEGEFFFRWGSNFCMVSLLPMNSRITSSCCQLNISSHLEPKIMHSI